MLKKLAIQSVICLLILGIVLVPGKAGNGLLADCSNRAKLLLAADYDLADVTDNVMTLAAAAAEKPKELYLAAVGDLSDENFVAPIDEIAVSVFNQSENSQDLKYMSDESITVYSSNRGMVENVSKDEASGTYTIELKHDNDINTNYIGCTNVYVKENERVGRSQIIGEVDGDGISKLTFQLWKDGLQKNPSEYMKYND